MWEDGTKMLYFKNKIFNEVFVIPIIVLLLQRRNLNSIVISISLYAMREGETPLSRNLYLNMAAYRDVYMMTAIRFTAEILSIQRVRPNLPYPRYHPYLPPYQIPFLSLPPVSFPLQFSLHHSWFYNQLCPLLLVSLQH